MAKLAKYELLAKIASGGMAEIFVARTRVTGPHGFVGAGQARPRVCVVKKLLPQHATNDEFIQMFLDEGRITALFDHPNIVRVFDFGSEEGSHYVAMDYLHGEDLRTVLRALKAEGRAVPLAVTLSVISAVCAGLHHAHEMRGAKGEPLEIVHRDISPHNVFLTFDGAVKLVDFGIAKSTDRDWETKHGTIKGKVPYMSPEQIKGRALDRRSDLYAVGVVLYELALGRRPYVLATGGDFAVMMAIARHDVRAPTAIDPSIAPELERILMKAIAYDRKERYQTALELQNDLDAFAKAIRVGDRTKEVVGFLEGLFESRVEKWRAAEEAQGDLAEHVVEVEEERAQSEMIQEDPEEATEIDKSEVQSNPIASLAPAHSAASLVASTSAAVASVVEIFGTTVVTLHGRIDEQFDGKALGGSLSGTVLFDMAGVERITSFGVREWLEMTSALSEDVDAYLVRCPEPVVTQLSLVRAFAGNAKVVSFDIPFLCDDCGNSFARLIDCAHDEALIKGQSAPVGTCPRCGGEAKLDDDLSYLSFAAPFAGVKVPERLRAVIGRLDVSQRGAAEVVDKVITPTETRVRVHQDVDPAFRWNRVLDGLEGNVVIDFRGAARFGRDAAGRFARAVSALGAEVTTCDIVECPVEVALALAKVAQRPEIRVGSLAFEGRCAACAAARTGAVARRALAQVHRGSAALFVPCRRCNGPLDLGAIAPVLKALFEPSTPVVHPPSVEIAAPPPVSVVTPVTVTPAPPPRKKVPTLALGIGAAVVVVLIGSVAFQHRRAGAASTPPAPVASVVVDAGSAQRDGVERQADGVYVSVHADSLETARASAIAQLLAVLQQDIDPGVRVVQSTLPVVADDAAAAAFTDSVGTFASPDRVGVERNGDALTARYRIATAGWQRARDFYSAKQYVANAGFVVVFPTHGQGLVITGDSSAKPLPTGGLVTQVDGRPITSLDAITSLGHGRHTLLIVAHGERALIIK